MTAKTIINANQKGGVGKTTSTSFEAIIASLPNEEFNNKCLLIDFDKQANATSIMGKTFDKGFPSTVISAVRDNDLKGSIVELTPNLHMIAGGGDMAKYGLYLELHYPFKNDTPQHVSEVTKQRTFHFSKMLDPLRELYDYIWIDVGPSTDIKVDNAMVCADYFVIPQETKTYSFEGSLDIINVYLQTLIDDFGEDFKGEVLGLLPFLLQPKRDLHESIIAQTKEAFGENFTFNAIVNNQKRIDDYPEYGISVIDHHDRKVFALFADIFKELEERIELFESLGDIPEDYTYKPRYLNGNKLTDSSRKLDLGTFEPKAGA